MKTKIFSFLIGFAAMVQVVSAQTTIYKMHVKMKDGSIHTVKADDVMEVYFTASQPYDPSHPVTADVESIHAPKDGGIYTIHINSDIPLSINSGNSDNMVDSGCLSNFLNQAPVSLTSNYEDGVLTIIVHSTTNYIVDSRDVKLYDLEGTEAFSIPVSQDGDPNATLIGNAGRKYISDMVQAMYNSHAKYRKADLEYTGLLNMDGFKAPLDAHDYRVRDIWCDLYQGISRNNALLQHCDGRGMDLFKPMCIVLNALSYYNLVTFFGDVPYVTYVDNSMAALPKKSSEEIFHSLIEQLKSAMKNMDDKVTGFVNSPEMMYSLSKDAARVLLANIYMYQGRYIEAQPLLEDIVGSNRYKLVSAVDNLDPQCSEIIWSQAVDTPTRAGTNDSNDIHYNDNLCIYQTYSDVLLSLAECETKQNNDMKAKEYLHQVTSVKGIETISSETLTAISEVRHRIQSDFGGYFAFLKRTGLAQSTLGLKEYLLLFPIPWEALSLNANLVQNPGY